MTTEEKPVILVVDDDEGFAHMMRDFFERLGYKVLVARAYPKAIRIIRQHHERMIAFVDIHLPGGKNGYDILAFIKKVARHRMIAYSWSSDLTIESRVKAIRAGALHVYKKTDFNDIDWDDLLMHLQADVATRIDEVTEESRDGLTKLLQPAIFDAIVESELESSWSEVTGREGEKDRANRHPEVFSLATLDVDYFKEVNDQHGHPTGNKVLVAIADLIRKYVRPSDQSCRSGGDELMILFAGLNKRAAKIRCLALQEAVRDLDIRDPEGRRVPVSISVGVAQVTRGRIGRDPQRALMSLKERSDKALYKAKRARPGGLTKRGD